MTTHVVTARRTDNNTLVRIDRRPPRPILYRCACRAMQRTLRNMPWLHNPGCNVRLAVEPVAALRNDPTADLYTGAIR